MRSKNEQKKFTYRFLSQRYTYNKDKIDIYGTILVHVKYLN